MAAVVARPHPRSAECRRAATILNEFTIPSANRGPDKLIPQGILAAAKGLAIITVFRIGFVVTVRAGSGLVVARDGSGNWSAPTCIGMGGMGGGLEIGGEITNFVIVLNSDRAVRAFSQRGQVTLGGSLSVAAGPLGRAAEADVALNKPAAFYTYSRTRGLYAGLTIEGAVIMERRGANRKVYGTDVRSADLLNGRVGRPREAIPLYATCVHTTSLLAQLPKHEHSQYSALEAATGGRLGSVVHGVDNALRNGTSAADTMSRLKSVAHRPTASSSNSSSTKEASTARHSRSFSFRSKNKDSDGSTHAQRKSFFSRGSHHTSKSKHRDQADVSSNSTGGNMLFEQDVKLSVRPVRGAPVRATSAKSASAQASKPARRSTKSNNSAGSASAAASSTASTMADLPFTRHSSMAREPDIWDDDVEVTALFDYQGTMDCDLSFRQGDRIKIITRTDSRHDWWEGEHDGRIGIFPANFTSDIGKQ
ncbi:uncharacterized protein MONBRDRAFT_34268 [Monosiga brevicollis MX1]|uniref:SH3 domain-containing YSC84-like protein 1 n=1 Tax=Monosiga brevicollis TaxID=81824 RepID=A9VAL2_MONBE|nr:uncharacterized protein MONBRDRAFT_34268 [Monosiga brevicollis MX1]EDQ85341.1 predicted protein [Monosiga brevicollis MX1]|eukprot:XP_001749752.1 hypothetical protein [Monosiga brevicollis MX1]